MIEQALAHVEQGWAVFPLLPNSKIPGTAHGFKNASRDPDTIRRWWSECPGANIGIAAGQASGLAVVDVDTKRGKRGAGSLALFGALPETLKVFTPSGGWHLYFLLEGPLKSRNGLLPGIDLKADGGYVVGAGSAIDGKPYAYADPEASLTALPDRIYQMLSQPRPDFPAPASSKEELEREIQGLSREIEAHRAEYAALAAQDRPERILLWKLSPVHDLERRRERLTWQLRALTGERKATPGVDPQQIERARQFPLERVLPPGHGEKIVCPLHDDHDPSMLVKNGFGYCFACEGSLDSIGYLMRVKGMGFREAVGALQ